MKTKVNKIKHKKEKIAETIQLARQFEEDIIDRVQYVIDFICSKTGAELHWVAYEYNCPEGDYGKLDLSYLFNDDFEFSGEGNYEKASWIDKNNMEQHLEDFVIPTRYIFEDFEEEVVEGIKKYKELEEQREKESKEKAAATKQKNQELKKAALKKLTKEEKKALGIK